MTFLDCYLIFFSIHRSKLKSYQVLTTNKEETPKKFIDMDPEDVDLTMFTVKDISLSKIGQRLEIKIELKRKISKELLTTFLPTILLLLITFTSILFDKSLFGDALAVNLTIMTIKIEELPSTSDTKMIDIWLIGCLLVPFTEVVLRTLIEVLGNYDHCDGLEDKESSKIDERREAWKDVSSTHGSPSDGGAQFMADTVVSLLFNEYICIS